jgi:hypothetical protein
VRGVGLKFEGMAGLNFYGTMYYQSILAVLLFSNNIYIYISVIFLCFLYLARGH